MYRFLFALPLALAVLLAACEPGPSDRAGGDELHEHAAFIQGHLLGQHVNAELAEQERYGGEFDRDEILQGFRSGLRGDSLGYSPAEVDSIMMAFQQRMVEQHTARMQTEAAEQRAEGDRFIAEYDQQDDVVTTESGLRYRVIEEGQGAPPTTNDRVLIHYEGRLTDGSVFDSSRERQEPARFPVAGLVPGFTEVLQLMRPGAQYEVVLPPELAYGDEDRPGIPAGSTLIFDVELLEVDRP